MSWPGVAARPRAGTAWASRRAATEAVPARSRGGGAPGGRTARGRPDGPLQRSPPALPRGRPRGRPGLSPDVGELVVDPVARVAARHDLAQPLGPPRALALRHGQSRMDG